MYDVAIVGGGPAGSTAATLLAKAGRRVGVFEREKFPRFHIGESLLPFSMPVLQRLGVMPKIEAAGFMPKHGAEVAADSGESETRFYFKNGFRPDRAVALQVERSRFDKLMLDHAAESGAEVFESTVVGALNADAGGVAFEAAGADGAVRRIQAKFLLDCSGRNAVVGTRFNLKRVYPKLRKFAVYAHYTGVRFPSGIDGTLTRMIRADDHWFWMIPLSEDLTSIGVVMDLERFKAEGLPPANALDHAIASSPVLRERLADAERVTQVHASSDYSFRNLRLRGDRWLLAGDAAGFIDPIFSSGVFLAILGGEQSAGALGRALDQPKCADREFRAYEKKLRRVMRLYLGFVNGWYKKEFVETILNPTEFLKVVPAVNAVLAGDLGGDFSIRWRLWLFHAVVAAQKFVPLSPRLHLSPGVSS